VHPIRIGSRRNITRLYKERIVEKTFPVEPGGELRIETEGGDILVQPSNDAVVKVTAKEKFDADSDAAADDILKGLTLTIEKRDNGVIASSKYEKESGFFNWHGSWPPVHVDFIVTVPASFAADLSTSGGNIDVGNLAGRIRAHTSGGDIVLGRMGGPVDASTSGGNVSLAEGHGRVVLRTSGGNIAVGRVAGPAELSTSGGNVHVASVEDSLQASTSGGDVQAGISGEIRGDCLLRTSGGTVKVSVDPSARFNLDAATSGGRVDARGLTITLERESPERDRLVGSVNGGGPLIRLRSSGGDIEVKLR
jgi:hypothetical protein